MKKNYSWVALWALVLAGWLVFTLSSAGVAEEKPLLTEQTYAIENMTCAACPITVKKAMSRIDGVARVSVDFAAKTATAFFDPAKATDNDLAKASTDVGFPATLISQDQHE